MNQTIIESRIQSICFDVATRMRAIIGSKAPLSVQAHVIKILGKTHIPEVTGDVVNFFQNHPDLEDAILGVAELPPDIAVNLLITRVQEKKAENRDIIAEQLGRFKQPAVFETLKSLLEDEDRHVRFQAAQSLFTIGGRDAALALCRFISDPDEWISMTILKMLCQLKEHESIPFLAEQFTKDTDLRRKAQMVSFLSKFRSVTLVNIFDEGLKGKDARLKANSIEAIGQLELPEREIKQRIEPFLNDPNNRIRANAILALAKSELERVRPEIVKMVNSSDVQLRRSAAYILGQINPQGNEELAEKLLADSSADVRKRMVLSLKAFPREFVQKQLEKMIADENKWIRKYSVEQAANFPQFPKNLIIKQLRTETAYPNLVACMEFFARHPDEEAARLIRQRVKDKRHQVVDGVIRSIGAMYGIKGLQAIASQINYRDPKILKSFVVTHFGLGGIDILNSIIEKAIQMKSSSLDNPFLDSIEGCIDILNLKENMPRPLQTELIKELADTAKPSLQTAPVAAAPIKDEVPTISNACISNASIEEGKPVIPTSTEPEKLERTETIDKDLPADTISSPKEKLKSKLPAEFQAGVKAFNLGKYAKAKKAFNLVIENHPNITKAFLYLGLIAYDEKDYENARAYLTRFLTTDPKHMKAVSTMVKVLKNLREWSNLVETIENFLGSDFSCDDNNIRLVKELGRGYIFCGSFEQAKKTLEKVFQFDPTDHQTAFLLAMACYHLKEFTKAESLLLDILRKVQKSDRLNMMADSLLEKIRQATTTSQESENSKPSLPSSQPSVSATNDDSNLITPSVSDSSTVSDLPSEASFEKSSAPLSFSEPPIKSEVTLPTLDLDHESSSSVHSSSIKSEKNKPFLDLSELDIATLKKQDVTEPTLSTQVPKQEFSFFENPPTKKNDVKTPSPNSKSKASIESTSLSFSGEGPSIGEESNEKENFPTITMPGTLDELSESAKPTNTILTSLPKPPIPPKKPSGEPPEGENNDNGSFKLPPI